MRFHSPDKFSPFNAGGINAYIYCIGDPVNLSDPTGNFPIWARIAGGLFAVGAVTGVASAFTEGDTRSALIGVTAAAFGIGAGVIGSKSGLIKRSKIKANFFSKNSDTPYKHLNPDFTKKTLLSTNKQTGNRISEAIGATPIITKDSRRVANINNLQGTSANPRKDYFPDAANAEHLRQENIRLMQQQNEVAQLQAILEQLDAIDRQQIARATRTPQRTAELQAQNRVLRRS